MNRLSKIPLILMLLLSNSSILYAAGKKDTISLEQASEMVRLQSKGKVLSARTTNFNGGRAHRIQVITPSGRVKIFQIPIAESHFRKPQHYNNPRYPHDKTNIRSNYSNRSNLSNYRAPSSRTTSRKSSTSSSGGNKKK
ncbi:MAG: hypothetical protein L3J83_10095 [Proteobacteria bacterium]|nr:hypothetical protein [Pseudomonadota bacterium]